MDKNVTRKLIQTTLSLTLEKTSKTMAKKQIILISDKPGFCILCSKHLSELLNTKITFTEVLDELFLYELGFESDKPLAQFVRLFLQDVKEAVDIKETQRKVKEASRKFGI